jgi:hypothetical protein
VELNGPDPGAAGSALWKRRKRQATLCESTARNFASSIHRRETDQDKRQTLQRAPAGRRPGRPARGAAVQASAAASSGAMPWRQGDADQPLERGAAGGPTAPRSAGRRAAARSPTARPVRRSGAPFLAASARRQSASCAAQSRTRTGTAPARWPLAPGIRVWARHEACQKSRLKPQNGELGHRGGRSVAKVGRAFWASLEGCSVSTGNRNHCWCRVATGAIDQVGLRTGTGSGNRASASRCGFGLNPAGEWTRMRRSTGQ